jgi:undecaprenyl-diphosphatase
MDLSTAIVMGIVEGFSEFLPISSTGHLILTSHLLGLKHSAFIKSFEIAIQAGAILSVVALYWRDLLVNPAVMKRIVLALLPTGLIGLAFYKIIKSCFMGSTSVVLWALAVGGVFLVVFECLYKEKGDAIARTEDISYRQALIIGFFQALAVIPGVSRSASTIIGGLVLGLKRTTIVEFSFLLAVPTMILATGYDLFKSASRFSLDQLQFLAVGFVMSFIVALLSIKFLLRFIQIHTFISFGIYRIALVFLWGFFLL